MALLGPNGQPASPPPSTPPSPEPSPEGTPEPAPPTRVVTAFLVYQMPNGQWIASEALGIPIWPSRPPLPDDLIAGAENIKSQVIARKTADLAAVATVKTQMATARQIQEQQAAEALQQHIERTRSRG